MTRELETEDLWVLARRGELREAELRRLRVALASSRELELLYQAGVGFDESARVVPGDETRIAELVSRTLEANAAETSVAYGASARPRSSRSATLQFAASVALGMLLSAPLASAWQYCASRGWLPFVSVVKTPSRSAPAPRSASAESSGRLQPAEPAPPPVVAAPPNTDTRVPGPSSAGVREKIAPRRKPVLDAGQLFASASEARRRGDVSRAIAEYEELGRRFPGSDEAADARVLLGKLRLSQRAPGAALRDFSDYGAGALSPEALWGRAEALRSLASPEERAVLEQILTRHADSPYGAAARERLEQLSR